MSDFFSVFQDVQILNCEHRMENDTQLVVCELGNPMVAGANVRKLPFSFLYVSSFEKSCLRNKESRFVFLSCLMYLWLCFTFFSFFYPCLIGQTNLVQLYIDVSFFHFGTGKLFSRERLRNTRVIWLKMEEIEVENYVIFKSYVGRHRQERSTINDTLLSPSHFFKLLN